MAESVFAFVDGISGSPTVRLDLHDDAPFRVVFDGTSCPPPPMNRQVVANMLVDGGSIPAAAYGNRTLNIVVQASDDDADARITALQDLHRELNRPRNTLLWQPDDTLPPVFFRTFRAPDYDPSLDFGVGLDEIRLAIPAEPFALGLPETLAPGSIGNNPMTGGGFFDVTGVKGDVETPLLMSVSDADFESSLFVVATRRHGDPTDMEWSKTISGSHTPDTDWEDVGSFTWPDGTASANRRGSYRMFIRATKSSSTLRCRMRLKLAGATFGPVTNNVAATTDPFWFDLGVVQNPAATVGAFDGYGAELAAGPQTITVQTQWVAGTGTLDLVGAWSAPADEELAFVKASGTSGTLVLDGPNRAEYVLSGAGVLAEMDVTVAPRRWGSLPKLSVGSQVNRVFIVNGVDGGVTVGTGTSATWSARYWPRYLHVRPTAT